MEYKDDNQSNVFRIPEEYADDLTIETHSASISRYIIDPDIQEILMIDARYCETTIQMLERIIDNYLFRPFIHRTRDKQNYLYTPLPLGWEYEEFILDILLLISSGEEIIEERHPKEK